MSRDAPMTVTTPRPYKTVHIINPNVVDAVAVNDHKITFLPKGIGAAQATEKGFAGLLSAACPIAPRRKGESATHHVD